MVKYLSELLYFYKRLPKGKYFFKFIVDNDWRYSTEYPQACDHDGNLNNYIDVRDPQKTIVLSEIDTVTNSMSKFTSRIER